MNYEPSDKHKLPWQRGRRGSLCPDEITLEDAQRMLTEGLALPGADKRFGTDGERAFCAQEHAPGRWHGYPVGWEEVPPTLREAFRAKRGVGRRAQRRFWKGVETA